MDTDAIKRVEFDHIAADLRQCSMIQRICRGRAAFFEKKPDLILAHARRRRGKLSENLIYSWPLPTALEARGDAVVGDAAPQAGQARA
jgi:hypothetical protein